MPEEEASEWPSGREGYRMMAEMGSGIIDGPLKVEQLISAGDNVVVRWKQTGMHVGEMGNIEPSNEAVTITGIEIDRFEDGQLAETWQEVNMMGMLMQIGVIPADLFDEEMPSDD